MTLRQGNGSTPPAGGVGISGRRAAWRRNLLLACLSAWPIACTHMPGLVRLDAAPQTWARYEGRRIALPDPVSVIDNRRLVSEGVVEVSFAGRLFQPTEVHPPGANATALAEANARARAVLELGPQLAREPPGPARPWRTGTRLRHVVVDVVAVAGEYRLRLAVAPEVEQAPRPQLPPRVGGDLVVASFNLLGFFNGDGAGGGFPTTRGARSATEFARQRAKILATLATLKADVVALNEVENDGYGPHSAIAELCAALNARLGAAGDYRYVEPPSERLGGDEIAVGIIYRAGRVQLHGPAETLATGAFAWGNRAPLVQSFEPVGGGLAFTVVANHLKSKTRCPLDDARNADRGDGQGCWNALRGAAVRELADWLARTSPRAHVLILGDLNAHGQEDPVRALRALGYVDVMSAATHARGPQYSYVFNGLSGRLDHALASPGLARRVTGAGEWHINADELELFDYSRMDRPAEQQRWYRPDPFRSSDHDPLLIGVRAR